MTDYHYTMTSVQVDESLFYRRSDVTQRLRFLLKYAVVAPSTRNSQPWLFRLQQDEIWIYSNSARWLKIADADKRQLHIALGGCLQNLLIAAEYYRYKCQVRYFPSATQPDLVAIVSLRADKEPPQSRTNELLHAVSQRRTARGSFQKQPVEPLHWQKLQECCMDGIEMITSQRFPRMSSKLLELTGLADQVIYNDRAYRREWQQCISAKWYGQSSLRAFFQLIRIKFGNLSKRYAKLHQRTISSAPGIAILCAADNSSLMHVKCGQVFQNMALVATTLGMALQPMSQVLEIPEIRDELLGEFGKKSLQPLCVFRLGYMKRKTKATPRRPLEDVLI